MPNTARRGTSQRPGAIPIPPHLKLSHSLGHMVEQLGPEEPRCHPPSPQACGRRVGPPPTIGDGEAGECVHGAGGATGARAGTCSSSSSITLLMNRLPTATRSAAGGLLANQDQLLSPKTSTDMTKEANLTHLKVPRRKTGHSAFSSIGGPAANVQGRSGAAVSQGPRLS